MSPLPNPDLPLEQQGDLMLLSICNWAEGRSTGLPGMTGIACVVRNRVNLKSWMGHSYTEVILKPGQFDAFLPNDPNYPKLLHPLSYETALVWEDAYLAAYRVYGSNGKDGIPDVTFGSIFYYTLPLKAPPRKKDGSRAWGPTDESVVINGITFHRPSRAVPGMPVSA